MIKHQHNLCSIGKVFLSLRYFFPIINQTSLYLRRQQKQQQYMIYAVILTFLERKTTLYNSTYNLENRILLSQTLYRYLCVIPI